MTRSDIDANIAHDDDDDDQASNAKEPLHTPWSYFSSFEWLHRGASSGGDAIDDEAAADASEANERSKSAGESDDDERADAQGAVDGPFHTEHRCLYAQRPTLYANVQSSRRVGSGGSRRRRLSSEVGIV